MAATQWLARALACIVRDMLGSVNSASVGREVSIVELLELLLYTHKFGEWKCAWCRQARSARERELNLLICINPLR